ncbi:MAG: threonine dehydratase, partial [Chloroflexota bacterium]
MVNVSSEAIRSAHARIPSAFRDSPQFVSESLSEAIGVPVVVKLETPNPIGAFKGRGTWLAVAELLAEGRVGDRQGLVAAS